MILDGSVVRDVVLALVRCKFLFCGLRPLGATPPDCPVVLIDRRDAHGLMYALDAANESWRSVEAWEVVGSDAVLRSSAGPGSPLDAILPPGMARLQSPVQVSEFGDSDTVGRMRRESDARR